MYNVLDVSRYIINYCNDNDSGISNLKLQKILYFVQAFFLISTPEQCFKEKIEAWEFGPVVPVAYREYKQFGGCNIPKINSYIEMDFENMWNSKIKKYDGSIIADKDKERIKAVVNKFADYTATDLVRLTHNQAPWKDAYIPHMNNEITTRAIKEYFND